MIDWATAYWSFLLDTLTPAQIGVGVTFAIHEIVYFATYIPWFVMDFLPYSFNYKLQKNKPFTYEKQIKCVQKLLFNHFVIELPLMFLAHEAFKFMKMDMSLPLPSWSSILWVCLLSFIVEDFYFYWIHRLLHHGVWYKYIHKIHHENSAPFGIAAEYAHPVETVFLGIGTILGPFMFADHVFTMHFWMMLRLFQTIEAHVGYDFPFSPRQWIPFYGGAEHHDFHHETFTGNFASSFIIWDYVFGTDVKYRQRRNKRMQKEGFPLRTIWDYLIYDHLFVVPDENANELEAKTVAGAKVKAQ